MPPKPAVFLDRDGTLIEDVHYLARPDQVRLLPGAASAVRRINATGTPVIVVTNQAGVAKGLFPESRIAEVHDCLSERLAEAGAHIDAYYYCPHGPTDGCGCRKPRPGMLRTAAVDCDLVLARSWMVGDKLDDAKAGVAAGCKSLLVRTGHGSELPATAPDAEGILPNLAAAVAVWEWWRAVRAAA